MFIRELIWDQQNIDHIAVHHVEQDEVEDIAFGKHLARRAREENRYLLFGQTAEGRYLWIVIDHEGERFFYVVTARDMTPDERRLYQRTVHK
ncbi:MAG: BrnT family toxin [Chloroflexi bacterium]|nr:BrnT family toxin [Chloroflexota bacterium]